MKIFSTLLLMIFSCNISATDLMPFIAKYELSFGGIPIATETRVLNKFGNDYVYTAKAKTSGLTSFLGDISIDARSLFSINESGVDSQSYIINEKKDGKLSKSYALNISSKNNIVLSTSTISAPEANNFKSLNGNIVDPLNLFLAISNDLKNNKKTLNYQVADGKSVKLKTYKKISTKPYKVGNNIDNIIEITEANNSNIRAFFSPKNLFLPVFIERTKNGKKFKYKLIGLKINNQKDNLQVVF